MAIPNPNPNIEDGKKCDNKTWSSNKIDSLIKSSQLPVIGEGDEGKVVTVGEDGYKLDTPVAPTSIIDDSTASASTVYSSSKVNNLLANKLDKVIIKSELISNATNESLWFFRMGNVCIIECQTTLKSDVSIADQGTLDLYTIQTAANMPDELKASSLFISSGKVGMVRLDNTTGKLTLYNQSGSPIAGSSAINFVLVYAAVTV